MLGMVARRELGNVRLLETGSLRLQRANKRFAVIEVGGYCITPDIIDNAPGRSNFGEACGSLAHEIEP